MRTLTIIVTYNRIELLKECIAALSNSQDKCDILIVNNASTDGTKDYLDTIDGKYNDIKFYIYNMDTNLNGAGGYNFGIREALKLPYDFFWLMDDDCIVKDDSLTELYKVHNETNGQYGFLSSKVLWIDNTICKTNVQRKRVARKIKDFDSHVVKVDFCSFVSCFVKKEDVKNIGLPIKEFVIWTDDLEWTRRLTYKKVYDNAKTGYLCNDSIVTHKCKENIGVDIARDTNDRYKRYKYIYRNDVVCFRREELSGHLYMLFRNIYHIFKILFIAPDKKIDRIKVLLNGYIEGYKFHPMIENNNKGVTN